MYRTNFKIKYNVWHNQTFFAKNYDEFERKLSAINISLPSINDAFKHIFLVRGGKRFVKISSGFASGENVVDVMIRFKSQGLDVFFSLMFYGYGICDIKADDEPFSKSFIIANKKVSIDIHHSGIFTSPGNTWDDYGYAYIVFLGKRNSPALKVISKHYGKNFPLKNVFVAGKSDEFFNVLGVLGKDINDFVIKNLNIF